MATTVDMSPERLTGPIGQALASGRLLATVRSKRTGEHITVRFSAKCPPEGNGRWRYSVLQEARKVYVDVPRPEGEAYAVGALNPGQGGWGPGSYLWTETRVDPAREWTALLLLAVARGEKPVDSDQYEILLGTSCLRCGAELTDPVSIERNIGPECFGKDTGSRHQAAARNGHAAPEKASPAPAGPDPAPEAATAPSAPSAPEGDDDDLITLAPLD